MSSPCRGVIVIVGESENAMLPSMLLSIMSSPPISRSLPSAPMLVDVEKFDEMLETFRNCGASRYRRQTTLSKSSSFRTWLTALL